ncbi:MAG: sulfotransferase [Candidatus Eisenbacteria bacterium]|nr:sulfotransferase [Candidatus Eisenbacteria bacterium]
MRLPNFLLIGAPKCGTTSLYHYLGQHPEIYLPDRKELHYFTYHQLKKQTAGPGDERVLDFACSTRAEYEAHYREADSFPAAGDLSPSYFCFPESSRAIREELGDVRIILSIRDPIEKAYSQYMHLVRDGREHLSFHEGLLAEEERIRRGYGFLWRYASSSLYADRIDAFVDVFGRDRVKILLFEDLVRSPHSVLRDLFLFLGVDSEFRPDLSRVYNRSGRPRSLLLARFLSKQSVLARWVSRKSPRGLRTRLSRFLLDFNTGPKEALEERSVEFLRGYFRSDAERLILRIGRKPNW